MVMHKRSCTTLTLAEKVEVLKRLEANETQQSIARYFKVSHSQVSRIRKNKELLYKKWSSNVNPETKRQRRSKFEIQLFEQPFYMRLKQERKNEVKFAEDLPRLLQQYAPRDIFGASETSLYWRAIFSGHLSDTTKYLCGTRVSNSRLTVLLTANMDGSEKLEPLVIGKSKCPHCFRTNECLPLIYTADINSSMTKAIWSRWISQVDAFMQTQNRSILLICDDREAHNVTVPLRNVVIVKLSSSPTSPLQPLQQGVTEAYKQNYQAQLKRRVFENVDSDLDAARANLLSISLLDSLRMQRKAWEAISQFQISLSFSASSFQDLNPQKNVPVMEDSDSNSDQPIDLSCSKLKSHESNEMRAHNNLGFLVQNAMNQLTP